MNEIKHGPEFYENINNWEWIHCISPSFKDQIYQYYMNAKDLEEKIDSNNQMIFLKKNFGNN